MVTKATRTPVRILHVLGGMERAGAETWLMHLLRMIDRDRYRMDFLVHVPEPQDYDDEIRALGSSILPCPHTRNPCRYARAFGEILRAHGPYDVVHSHVHHHSGFVLRLAKHAGVPTRIAHSHLDDAQAEAHASRVGGGAAGDAGGGAGCVAGGSAAAGAGDPLRRARLMGATGARLSAPVAAVAPDFPALHVGI